VVVGLHAWQLADPAYRQRKRRRRLRDGRLLHRNRGRFVANLPCRKFQAWGPFLTSPWQGWISTLGVNLAPRGEICPLGGMFNPSFTLRDEHYIYYLEEWRGEQRISPPGDKIHPGGQIRPWGQSLPLGVKLRMGIGVRRFIPRYKITHIYRFLGASCYFLSMTFWTFNCNKSYLSILFRFAR
jgi:hypothetical protein